MGKVGRLQADGIRRHMERPDPLILPSLDAMGPSFSPWEKERDAGLITTLTPRWPFNQLVMAALEAAIQAFRAAAVWRRVWMAGSGPAMTSGGKARLGDEGLM